MAQITVRSEDLDKSSLVLVSYPKNQKKSRISQFLSKYRLDASSICLIPNNILGAVLPTISKNEGKFQIILNNVIEKNNGKNVEKQDNEKMTVMNKIIQVLEKGLGSLKGEEKSRIRNMVFGSLSDDEMKVFREVVQK